MADSSWVNPLWLEAAINEAQQGLEEGGIPIGSVLIDPDDDGAGHGRIVAAGHNMRVQNGDPTAHAEVSCIRNAGRRKDWHKLILVSTLSPCPMCTGTALLYKIPRIVVGENITFTSIGEKWFTDNNVKVHIAQNQTCIQMMKDFIRDKPELWNEDIHVIDS